MLHVKPDCKNCYIYDERVAIMKADDVEHAER
jgi:hypothetical protein